MSDKTIILLAMHGMPPSDYSREEISEWGKLHSTIERMTGEKRAEAEKRYKELDAKIRAWPRTPKNDPYHAASYRLAGLLKNVMGLEVVVGFNEFCNPSMQEGFAETAKLGAKKVVVITPMMTRGGSHSECDIPTEIEAAKKSWPHIEFSYVWPFDDTKIADFLSAQIAPYLKTA